MCSVEVREVNILPDAIALGCVKDLFNEEQSELMA
jgi:hypothetical protein